MTHLARAVVRQRGRQKGRASLWFLHSLQDLLTHSRTLRCVERRGKKNYIRRAERTNGDMLNQRSFAVLVMVSKDFYLFVREKSKRQLRSMLNRKIILFLIFSHITCNNFIFFRKIYHKLATSFYLNPPKTHFV